MHYTPAGDKVIGTSTQKQSKEMNQKQKYIIFTQFPIYPTYIYISGNTQDSLVQLFPKV